MKTKLFVAAFAASVLITASACAQTGTPEEHQEVLAMVETVPVTYNATIKGVEVEVLKTGDNMLPGPDERVDTSVVADQNCNLVVIVMKADPNISRLVDLDGYKAALAADEKAKLAGHPIFGPAVAPIDMAPFMPAVAMPPPDVPAVVIRWYNQAHVAVNEFKPAPVVGANDWLIVTAVD